MMAFADWFCILAATGLDTPHPSPWMILPFAILLLSIALMPFLAKDWWHHHYPKVALALGVIVVTYYVLGLGNPARMLHVAHEYVSFIALIGSLFIVAGGIHIRLQGEAKPAFNCLFLFMGALLANLIGTTGASVLLIRPWIRMNRRRISAFHVVFFIFVVSNVGGCLTPIGDPPLFLGYLKGVPFWWVLQNFWIAWAIATASILAIFYALDRRNDRQTPRTPGENPPALGSWQFSGRRNIGFLALILVAIFLRNPPGLSEGLMILAALGSWFSTPRNVHEANDFNFEPIREVAWLFVGIFATMVPALDYLEFNAREFGLNSDLKFFWATGLLSAGLDNAPTYLTFLAAAMGNLGLSLNNPDDVRSFIEGHGRQLTAISLGAVFFGAMTYVGNGPNFMVKAIAEHANISVPSFLAFLFRYAVPILIPVLILISLLFFSPWRLF